MPYLAPTMYYTTERISRKFTNCKLCTHTSSRVNGSTTRLCAREAYACVCGGGGGGGEEGG